MLYSGTSDFGFEALLVESYEVYDADEHEANEHFMKYFSRALNNTEVKYRIPEKELMAIAKGMEHF